MALIRAGESTASAGASSSGTGDAIIDNADALTVAGTTDITALDATAGLALTSLAEVTNGLHFVAPSGVSGAVVASFGAGDFLHGFILNVRGTAVASQNQNIYAAIAYVAGGMAGAPQNASWKGIELNLSAKQTGASIYDVVSGGADGSRWSTAPSRSSTTTQYSSWSLRAGVERVGDTVDFYIIGRNGGRILMSTETIAGAGEIALRLDATGTGRSATLTLATSGLAWAGNVLTAAAA